jgi:hypothetical protein
MVTLVEELLPDQLWQMVQPMLPGPLILQPEFVIFMGRWLVGGSGRCGRGPAVGAATPTSAAGGRGSTVGRASSAANRCWTSLQVKGISPGGGDRRVRSVRAATTRKAWASRARVAQRYQERQRRTWCWSRPHPVSVVCRVHIGDAERTRKLAIG